MYQLYLNLQAYTQEKENEEQLLSLFAELNEGIFKFWQLSTEFMSSCSSCYLTRAL